MLRLRDIMTREVPALSPRATRRQAVLAVAGRHVGAAPVPRDLDQAPDGHHAPEQQAPPEWP